MIVVDDAYIWHRGKLYCHMLDDQGDREALHAFAASIGLKRCWWHGDRKRPWMGHYDVNETIRAKAIEAGAREIAWRDIGVVLRRLAPYPIAERRAA